MEWKIRLCLRVRRKRLRGEAGALLREFYAKGVETEYKGDVDLVTEADRSSERLIVSRLKTAFPSHGVYGEEGTRSGLESEYRWYVDPLDGTTNFAHGFPGVLRDPGVGAESGWIDSGCGLRYQTTKTERLWRG